MKNIIYILIFFLSISTSYAQVPIPAKAQSGPIMLVGATAHIGNGEVIENSAIGFANGKLTLIGDASIVARGGFEVIDVSGKHVYPGFILPNSQIGLIEVSSVRAMSDNSERGAINPSVRSLISYNTDSEMIPTMRFNGILLAESTPSGGRISGCSSVMEMEGWNWEDAAHSADIGIHLNWPERMTRRFDFSTFTVSTAPNKNYDKEVAELAVHFSDAAAYAAASDKQTNLKMEAMMPLLSGNQRLFIHADEAKSMVEAIRFAQDHGVKNITLIGGSNALHIAAFLKENKIPLIIPPVHSIPSRPDEDIDLPYRLPHLLTEAGVMVSLSHSGMLSQARNLPFYAGTAAAYGMDKEAALMTITSNSAKALGIEDRVGTIEVGKDATLFVSEGDALDIRTNQLSHAFISGKQIVLDNKQQALFKRYSDKYGHE